MKKILKILGKRGRITIPWEIRSVMGFAYNDVVSFEQNNDIIIVRREKLCDGCNGAEPDVPDKVAALNDLINKLTPEAIRALLIHLSTRWAEIQGNATTETDRI